MKTKQFRSEVRAILNQFGGGQPHKTYTDKIQGGGYSIMGGDRRVCFYSVMVPSKNVRKIQEAVAKVGGTVTGHWDLVPGVTTSINVRGVAEL